LPIHQNLWYYFYQGKLFFSAALEQDSSLIEEGVQQQVILATPTTLIALLRTVHYGWRQEQIAQHAYEISHLGQELHERMSNFVEHLQRMSWALNKAVESFNAAANSLETRILPSARKFTTLGAGSAKDMPCLTPILNKCRQMIAADDSSQQAFGFSEAPSDISAPGDISAPSDEAPSEITAASDILAPSDALALDNTPAVPSSDVVATSKPIIPNDFPSLSNLTIPPIPSDFESFSKISTPSDFLTPSTPPPSDLAATSKITIPKLPPLKDLSEKEQS